MYPRSFFPSALLTALLAILGAGCSASQSVSKDSTVGSGGAMGTGGASAGSGGATNSGGAGAGRGGATSTGGATTSGGATGSGGATNSGGAVTGRGGATSTGGATTSGGAVGSGGAASSGGAATGSGGATSTGGATGAGGAVGSGGAASSGGATGTGGNTGSGGATGSGAATGSLPWLKVVGNQIQVEATGQQVILRGVSLAGLGTQNGNKLGLHGAIDYLTNTNDTQGTSPGWYTKLLRIPVDTPNPNPQINTLLKPTVDYATTKGLYAIVDLHYVDNPYSNDANVKSFWTIVAPMFKDYPNVIYEVFNESSVMDSWGTYKPTMQAWVDLIRAAAPKNLIFAGSPAWDQTMGDAATNPLTGGNIVYTVHMYAQHYGSAGNRSQVEKCAAVNPVVMTEWGFDHDPNQPGENTNLIGSYGQPMLTWLEAMGGSWTGWCASDSWLPKMFTDGANGSWVLMTGQDNMGGFVKDWLYTNRAVKAPF